MTVERHKSCCADCVHLSRDCDSDPCKYAKTMHKFCNDDIMSKNCGDCGDFKPKSPLIIQDTEIKRMIWNESFDEREYADGDEQ